MTGSQVLRILNEGKHALFFRLESNENDPGDRGGPYRERGDIADVALREYAEELGIEDVGTASDRHPLPQNDVKMAPRWERLSWDAQQNYLFGFDKLTQLHNWFCSAKGMEDIEHTAVIGVYMVLKPLLIGGQFQAAAHREHMRHLFDLPTTWMGGLTDTQLTYKVDCHARCTSRE